MRKRTRALLTITCLVLALFPISAWAQTYSFSLDREVVDVYWESDGTATIQYELVLSNDPIADPMQYVDIGMPMDSQFSVANVTASVDGTPIMDVERSPVIDNGVALGLGSNAIPPGETGTVRMSISGVRNVLFEADISGYASVNFAPSWFDSELVHGDTDLTVRFHLPPGVEPEEPRWFDPPAGFPETPEAYLDEDGRVTYAWRNESANGYTPYVFGAAFPLEYVPQGTVQTPSPLQRLGISEETIFAICCVGGLTLLIAGIIAVAVWANRRRKLDYLPPKISIEGHGIKRGLTAVEAAILLERPLDRVLTMILFGLIKKEGARVTSEDPLEVAAITPAPEDMRPYEKKFLEAVVVKDERKREKELQKVAVELVKAVQKKMKGFSLSDTKKYYRSIVDKAWKQVEGAETPEVRSETYMEELEWTMLDRRFEDRTRRVFRTGPVFVPGWWGAYRPSYRASGSPSAPRTGAPTPSVPGRAGDVALPSLPGGQFAASVVSSVQNTAGNLVSSLTGFSGAVTKTTNPPPPPSRTGSSFRGSSGGGCACACACACAGCACACAGGGR